MYRTSDSKWLYSDDNWYTEDEASSLNLVKKLMEDAADVDNLTTVQGDVIIAYAQWQEIEKPDTSTYIAVRLEGTLWADELEEI